jgi:hypothetical protein
MSWLDDLVNSRTSQEKEAELSLKQHRERMDRAFRRLDRMVSRCLKDLGRAYWSNKYLWRVNGYLPSNGWEPHWKVEAQQFASSGIFFEVILCETVKGSETWYFQVSARDLSITTEGISEDALKSALREAFVAGPKS